MWLSDYVGQIHHFIIYMVQYQIIFHSSIQIQISVKIMNAQSTIFITAKEVNKTKTNLLFAFRAKTYLLLRQCLSFWDLNSSKGLIYSLFNQFNLYKSPDKHRKYRLISALTICNQYLYISLCYVICLNTHCFCLLGLALASYPETRTNVELNSHD